MFTNKEAPELDLDGDLLPDDFVTNIFLGSLLGEVLVYLTLPWIAAGCFGRFRGRTMLRIAAGCTNPAETTTGQPSCIFITASPVSLSVESVELLSLLTSCSGFGCLKWGLLILSSARFFLLSATVSNLAGSGAFLPFHDFTALEATAA